MEFSFSDQIPAELTEARDELLLSAIHKHINSIRNKEELPDQWKEFIIVPIHKKGDKADCDFTINFLTILWKILLSKLSPYIDDIISIIIVGFDVKDQLLIRFYASVRYWKENGSTRRQYISCS
jgi:hypothetical protein